MSKRLPGYGFTAHSIADRVVYSVGERELNEDFHANDSRDINETDKKNVNFNSYGTS